MKSVKKKRVLIAVTGTSTTCLLALCAARVLAEPAIAPAASLSGTTAIAPAIKNDTAAIGIPSVATAPLPQSQGVLDIECIDMPVADIVNIIKQSAGGTLDIIVTSDVDARLQSISLKNRTPEEAIRLVASAANLTLTRADSQTYIISKGAPGNLAAADNTNELLSKAMMLPGIGKLNTTEVPELAKSESDDDVDDPSLYRTVALRNVKPSMMAFWIDPSNHPKPIEFIQSDNRRAEAAEQRRLRRVIDRKEAERLNNQPLAAYGAIAPQNIQGYGQFSNPYAPYNPYVVASPQLNQGGRGNNRNNNNNNNRNNGNNNGGNTAQGLIPLPNGIEALVAVDPQNALLIRGTEEGINEIRQIIAFLDRPIGQVEIEAQFVTINSTATQRLGLLGATYRLGGALPSPGTPFEDGAVAQATGGSLGVGITLGNFRAVFEGLQSQGQAKVIASPRVTTFNNLTAQISSGTQQYIPVTESTTTIPDDGPPVITTDTNYIELTSITSLTVTPTINQDGTITIAMQPTVSSSTISNPADPANSPLRTDFQTIDTISNIRDGDTLAIGGIRAVTDDRTQTKVPILGDLPIVGRLFRRKAKAQTDNDLIIFVTARIVRRVNDPVRGT